MSTFFMRNEIISKDIYSVKISSFSLFLFYIAMISGVTKGVSQLARVVNLDKMG